MADIKQEKIVKQKTVFTPCIMSTQYVRGFLEHLGGGGGMFSSLENIMSLTWRYHEYTGMC